MNDYISTGSRFRYNTHKKQWTEAIEFYIRRSKLKPMASVYVHFLWQEKSNRRDPDNFSSIGKKFILDALVNAGILKDDGWDEIAGWSDYWRVDTQKPGVLVTLEERA